MISAHYRFTKEFLDALELDGVFLNPAQLSRLLAEARDIAQQVGTDSAPVAYAEIRRLLTTTNPEVAVADSMRLFAQHLLDAHPVS